MFGFIPVRGRQRMTMRNLQRPGAYGSDWPVGRTTQTRIDSHYTCTYNRAMAAQPTPVAAVRSTRSLVRVKRQLGDGLVSIARTTDADGDPGTFLVYPMSTRLDVDGDPSTTRFSTVSRVRPSELRGGIMSYSESLESNSARLISAYLLTSNN